MKLREHVSARVSSRNQQQEHRTQSTASIRKWYVEWKGAVDFDVFCHKFIKTHLSRSLEREGMTQTEEVKREISIEIQNLNFRILKTNGKTA